MIWHSGKPRQIMTRGALSSLSRNVAYSRLKAQTVLWTPGEVREAGRGGVKATVPFSLLFLPPPIPHLSDQVFLGYCLTAIDAAGATLGGFQAGSSGALR